METETVNSHQSKLQLLVESWLEFIRQEEMTLSEVEKGKGSYQKVFDTGVRLIDNKLLLESDLFDKLQEQCLAALKKGNPHEFQIGVTAPQIYVMQGKGSEQKLKYLPLFVIDISKLFQGNYRKTGWDLTEPDFQPVIYNLMRLYALEEEEAEFLVIKQGIGRFLEDAFKRKFTSLGDFIDQVDLPEGKYKITRSPYLVRFDFNPYNAQLKQDLRFMQQAERDRLIPGTPAFEYLFGKPQPPEREVMFWGAFPSHAPDEYQVQVLKHVQQNQLTAIWGAPGTGKTEVFEHLVALQVVNRALTLANGGEDKSNLTLFASTNNSAIQKFLERLCEYFPTSQLHLLGGNQSIIKKETLPTLQSKRDILTLSFFSPQAYEQASSELLKVESSLKQLIANEPIKEQQQAADAYLKEQLDVEISALNNVIEATLVQQSQLQQQLSNLPDCSNFPINAYQLIQQHLEQAWCKFPVAEDSLFKRARNWLNNVTEEKIFQGLFSASYRAAIQDTKRTDFPFEVVPVDRAALAEALNNVSQKLSEVQQWRSLNQELEQVQNRLDSLEHQGNQQATSRSRVQQQLDSYPTVDFYSRFYLDYHDLQVQLFQRAWEFLQQEVLRRQHEVLRALEIYGSALSGEGDALLRLETDGERIYRDLSLVFPVITSSLQSIRNMLPHLQPNCVDLALVDEAGTTLLHQAFPLLVRSRQAVVAGDPQQIEPIINLCEDSNKEYRQKAFLDKGLNNSDYYRYSPTAKYTATAYHRAAGASDKDGDLGAGIILRNHYRCTPSIIQFCIPNYPGGLIVKSPATPSALGTNLIAYHVEGSHLNNTNPEEIEAVVAVIEQLLPHGYCIGNSDSSKTIGVMSPFFQQANALSQRIQSQWRDFLRKDIGTVHNFQGGEKSVIIFSAYQCQKEHSFWYLNRRSNLLNTAVSRAIELFVLVGNLRELEQAGGETKRLVEHIKQYGEIRQLPTGSTSESTTKKPSSPKKVDGGIPSPRPSKIGQIDHT